ncbi:transcription factor S [Halomarina pelagica]|uniref:transcription factor S n=1 Tax=Halomarina pelagica TaxID=2961599 RepID=UPI0020C365C6|nr:transcription factor S [Halomarina sp. BND7]
MKFCDECGSMMHSDGETWECRSCGHTEARDRAQEAKMTTTQGQEKSEIVDVSDAEDRGLPTTTVVCPNCGNDTAYWYMQQIRSADESETRFLVCTECEHKWREDDH